MVRGPVNGAFIVRNGKTVAFTDDLIRNDGKIEDRFSLQDAIPEAKIGRYHGWAGRLGDLIASLDRLAAHKLDLLVPARGPVIGDPSPAISHHTFRVRHRRRHLVHRNCGPCAATRLSPSKLRPEP